MLAKFINRALGRAFFPLRMNHLVRNVPDSSKYKEPIDCSCIEYWQSKAYFSIDGSKSYICPSCGRACSGEQFVGAHVTVAGLPESKWFFVPLCPKCNSFANTKIMFVDTELVPVPDECYQKKKEE